MIPVRQDDGVSKIDHIAGRPDPLTPTIMTHGLVNFNVLIAATSCLDGSLGEGRGYVLIVAVQSH